MIDIQGGKILVECDSCEDVIESDQDEEWVDFWDRARREGWRVRKIGKDFVHGCPRHDPGG